jgi:hypothetical protein
LRATNRRDGAPLAARASKAVVCLIVRSVAEELISPAMCGSTTARNDGAVNIIAGDWVAKQTNNPMRDKNEASHPGALASGRSLEEDPRLSENESAVWSR